MSAQSAFLSQRFKPSGFINTNKHLKIKVQETRTQSGPDSSPWVHEHFPHYSSFFGTCIPLQWIDLLLWWPLSPSQGFHQNSHSPSINTQTLHTPACLCSSVPSRLASPSTAHGNTLPSSSLIPSLTIFPNHHSRKNCGNIYTEADT